jgi:hypothetical protein
VGRLGGESQRGECDADTVANSVERPGDAEPGPHTAAEPVALANAVPDANAVALVRSDWGPPLRGAVLWPLRCARRFVLILSRSRWVHV